MSLINQMLKDLEKRRSRDLETSDTLSQNITWETRPNQKTFNWLTFSIIFTLAALLGVIAYLLWERTTQPEQPVVTKKSNVTPLKKQTVKKVAVSQEVEAKVKKQVKAEIISDENYANAIDVDEVVEEDVIAAEDIDNSPPIKLQKTRHPLNSKQLAEIAYKKGYQLLQQGQMRKGKEYLREALSLYIPHIKAREMLAGIYIKSGHFISAAELLSEGVKIAPEYPLFAKLYARVLLEQNNPGLAIQILNRGSVSAVMNVEPDYYALLAATYQRVNDHQKATELYLKLVKIRPTTGVWWLGLGISLEKLGKNKEALEAYQRAQDTGNLKAGLIKFTNNKVSALSEIGFPAR
ncbi:MAG: tetratricopeptide repeat protein [Gammaproteobacteria bacterium]|nr:tetratricopeptide repeat protein [Gammaproteobacteria bacterium]MCW8987703.1 tetratricopeptide repeat protein [Gammaproteobacteria bacterium]